MRRTGISTAGSPFRARTSTTPSCTRRRNRRNICAGILPANTAFPVFRDGRCTADSDNLVIFGHNMEIGTMFAELIQYAEGDYFTAHPLIELETSEECRVYRVFAVAKIHKTDDWYGFIDASSDVEYETRVERLAAKALFCGEIPEAGTQLLTLSTCYGGESSRLVVVASRSD